eukprot:TRINITY_DN24907_c0_g1_i1.p1 TRINITY_DN24907_c0_g1~~TRINITY_DN24907_c0_g1_i1.p1  ORF type:complete len:805 (-),score=179.69 TRINITY_DN24907_c0_g1_i1:258-2672(-)
MRLGAALIVNLLSLGSAEPGHRQWPLRGAESHVSQIPASFDCKVRKLAYAYGKKLLPRMGAFESLYYALDLNAPNCTETLQPGSEGIRPEAEMLPPRFEVPAKAVFVAPDGDDHADGTEGAPLKSVQLAIDRAARSSAAVVLRGGTHFLEDTLYLLPQHSGVTITAYPGEQPELSGGKKLAVKWEQYRVSGSTNIWVADVKGQVTDIPGLQLNGERATRARYPNIPGGIEVSCGYGCMIDGKNGSWTPPDSSRYPAVKYWTDASPEHHRNTSTDDWFKEYMIGVDGNCSVYDPPVSYWCSEHPSGGGAFSFRTPSGLTYSFPNGPYEHGEDARLFVWRPARWANWMFDIANYEASSGHFKFGKGGNQGARGENTGGDFFIENVMEELDAPGEYFFDKRSGKLFLFYNGTGAPSADAKVVATQKQVLVNISGTQWNPVRGVKLQGVKLSAAAPTYMMPHGVPSAGDWALDRYGAVFMQGTENTVVDGCLLERLDGNAVMISGYNRNATIQNSDFAYLGGNAVVAWGYTNETDYDLHRPGIKLENAPHAGIDGTDGDHPEGTLVQNCSAREIGLYEKQSSFFIQAKTAKSKIVSNVFFNGPRAGINMNDGFGGGDEIAYNLVFSTCRESGDHGPFNSWDRQPFLTTVRTGQPDMIMQWRDIHNNFFIDNYSPQEDVDNDDGSCYYHTHDNFLVYGGQAMKNDFGGHDNHHYNNVDAYVGKALGVVPTLPGHEDYFYGNYVVMTGNQVGTCLDNRMHDNAYFTPDGTLQAGCGGFGGSVQKLPSDETILNEGRKKLGMSPAAEEIVV